MGRDFKIGLMSGVVLGFIALIWVATRPSQSPQARLREPSTANAQEDGTGGLVPDPTEERPSPRPTGTEPTLGGTASPDLTTVRPEPNGELFLPEQSPVARQPAPRPSETPNAPREENREEITTTRFHIVQSGETLSGIAQQYYGSASQWRTILEANQETIKNPDRISPGTKLIIPW
jgi:nucleoid-associated protein YgaU